jgi:hypothetical protein
MNPDLDELRSTQGIIRQIDVNNRVVNYDSASGGTISHSPGAARPFDGTLKRKRNSKVNLNGSIGRGDSGLNVAMNVVSSE